MVKYFGLLVFEQRNLDSLHITVETSILSFKYEDFIFELENYIDLTRCSTVSYFRNSV